MSDTQKHKKLNVPNLRFPGFSGEWKGQRLIDSCDIYDGTHQTPKYTKTGVPFLSVEDITALRNVEQKYISEESFQRDFKTAPQKGDILMTRIGDIGTSIVVNENKPLAYYVSLALIRSHEVDSTYLKSYIASPFFKRELYRRTIHVAFPKKINKEDIGECLFTFPSVQEQKKIAEFLSLIEERISIQNKVIEKLKSLIRELNNKLMDNPLWNKVYLGDFMQFYSTNSLSWEQLSYESGRMKNLHYGLIHIGLPTMTDCKDNTLPYIPAPFIPKQFTICKDGDIAFADASEDTEEVGKAIELYNTGSMDVVCGLHTIHGRDIMGLTVVGFKGFAFNSKYFHDQLRRLAQGSKVYSITAENIKNCYIYVPEVTEQRRIVGLLLCSQDKIKCAERELNSYEMQKQFMLSEMLV